ncbi:MAG: class I SAM-dependent methyltransferase [Clostridiales bacterium]|nr:class I SAM-dependent methyltransferase [Clostridiales bacterium]
MNCFHPGSKEITDLAVKLGGFVRGNRILELGCGEGRTIEYLQEKYGLLVTGCDINKDMIKKAKQRNPKLQIRLSDGVSLDFPSLYFDGAIMECSFSLMTRHQELLHELYCILKPGAVLTISDLYMLDPDPQQAKQQYESAISYLNRPREHSDCENETEYPSPFVLDGMFMMDYLQEGLREAGFDLISWEDRTQDLKNYIAQVLMDYGSFDRMWQEALPEGTDPKSICHMTYGKNTGYFLLAAGKGHGHAG